MRKNLISICIPTYNRSQYLNACIERLLPQIEKFEIPLCISDNASSDNTQEVVDEWKKKYNHIIYVRNSENIGPDKNFESVLKMAQTDYAWLLGDDDDIVEGTIEQIIQQLSSEDFDLVVVNAGFPNAEGFDCRVKEVDSKVFNDKDELLSQLGWHMTLLSSLIYRRQMVEQVNFSKYYNSNFLQTAALLEYLGEKETISVYWDARPVVTSYSNAGHAWIKQALDIFVKSWCDVVSGLPSQYSEKAKEVCIMKHGIKSGLFLLSGLIYLKENNVLTRKSLKRFDKSYFERTIPYPFWFLQLLSILPLGVVKQNLIVRKIEAKVGRMAEYEKKVTAFAPKYGINDIAIFIATLNRADFLRESIESLLNQTAGVQKIVVLDNNSEDHTESVVRSYADRGVEYLHVEERGFVANFKKVAQLSESPYTMIFHDDDLLHPRYLEYALNCLNKYDNLSLITTRYHEFFDRTPPRFKKLASEDIFYFEQKSSFAEFLYYKEIVAMQSAIYRTAELKQCPIDYERYGKFFDWPYLVEFAGFGNSIIFKDPELLSVRRHRGQETLNKKSQLTPQQIVNWDKCFYDAMKIEEARNREYDAFMNYYSHFTLGKYRALLSEEDRRLFSEHDMIALAQKSGIGLRKQQKYDRLKEELEIALITYNRKGHLKRTLDDILADDSPIKDLDIKILDNKSTDGSSELIDEYASRYENVKHIVHPRNIGGNANIARAFECSSKKYLWILCDDDFYDWSCWDEVESAMARDEDAICVSTYALTDRNSREDLLLQLTFVPGCIYKTDILSSTVIRNLYDNISNSFPHLSVAVQLFNDRRSIHLVTKSIVENGLVVPTPDQTEKSKDTFYHRGDVREDLFPTTRYFYWHSGFANSMVLLKDQKLAVSAIRKARSNRSLDVRIKSRRVLRHLVYISKQGSPAENLPIFWNYYYRCDSKTRRYLLKRRFKMLYVVALVMDWVLFVSQKHRIYSEAYINFVCAFIPKERNRIHFREKHSKYARPKL